jgi:ammonia channel protein AmtB
MKLFSFFAFALVFTAIIYPLEGAWTWGGKAVFGLFKLADYGFSDFAGSGIKMNVPSVASGIFAPMIAFDEPTLLYFPRRAPKTSTPAKAAAAPAICTIPEPAKSDFFFQVVFVATAMSIVSGAVAERMKLFSFFAFALVFTAIIYPLEGAWTWGGEAVFGLFKLSDYGFSDFAGSAETILIAVATKTT